MADDADVCIVGSGAGGSPLALELSRAGYNVVVLEKGPAYTRTDFVHDEIKIVRRNFFVPFVSDEPRVTRTSPDETGEKSNFGWISCCVGGGTVHWAGYSFRFSPDDFRRRTLSGGIAGTLVEDWPVSYADLEPYYEKAEREIGVSGTAAMGPFEPPRKNDYPLPPVRSHAMGALVDAAAKTRGLHSYPTPRAVLSQAYLGRMGCMYCDFCASYGCEFGAKGSTSEALLARAVASGRCRIISLAMAKNVRVDSTGRAKSVVYSDASGTEHELHAKIIILSCSAIESARLLLNSTSSRFPHGLANSSGLVGKGLMLLTQGGVTAHFHLGGAAGLTDLGMGDPFLGRTIRDFYSRGGTLNFDFAPMSPIQTAERLSKTPEGTTIWGKALKDRLRTHFRQSRHVALETFSECLPLETNVVDLDPKTKDRFGLPVARVTFAHHASDLQASAELVQHGVDVVKEMKPDAIDDPESGGIFDVLQVGTCRFGKNRATSVLDKNCRSHDVPNLYVVDGSFMPTSGAVPPTLTILANSFRVADAIIAEGKAGRGG